MEGSVPLPPMNHVGHNQFCKWKWHTIRGRLLIWTVFKQLFFTSELTTRKSWAWLTDYKVENYRNPSLKKPRRSMYNQFKSWCMSYLKLTSRNILKKQRPKSANLFCSRIHSEMGRKIWKEKTVGNKLNWTSKSTVFISDFECGPQ